MEKLSNETEELYKTVEKALKDIGLKPMTGVLIMKNIRNICKDLEDDVSYEQIVATYGLDCKPQSFTGIFKSTTGVSVSDVNVLTTRARRLKMFREKGFTQEQIDEIMKIVE